jgi:hypothetical protein
MSVPRTMEIVSRLGIPVFSSQYVLSEAMLSEVMLSEVMLSEVMLSTVKLG